MKKFTIPLFILSLFQIGFAQEELHRTGLLYEDLRLNPELKQVTDIPLMAGKSLLESVDLSSQMPPVGNQGAQGSCVGWAVGYYHKTHTEWREHGWNINLPQYQFSPAFIYNQINGGSDGGAYFSDALRCLTDLGCATMALMPYSSSNYTSWPSETSYVSAIPYRGDASYWIDAGNDNGLNLIIFKIITIPIVPVNEQGVIVADMLLPLSDMMIPELQVMVQVHLSWSIPGAPDGDSQDISGCRIRL